MSCTVANCEAKCFGMVTLKILTTTCLCYNSDKKAQNSQFPKRIYTIKYLNDKFLTKCCRSISKSLHNHLNPYQIAFPIFLTNRLG